MLQGLRPFEWLFRIFPFQGLQELKLTPEEKKYLLKKRKKNFQINVKVCCVEGFKFSDYDLFLNLSPEETHLFCLVFLEPLLC